MKYKIIVDKQSRTNPSDEKREYEIEIEELRCKGNVRDTLVITKDEDYVMRRLELTPYFVLKELEKPIKQVIPDVNIELFEGDNYIYIIDMAGNKFYAEYLINNEFNSTYVTKREMHGAINQSAKEVEISVSERLTEYSTTEEMQAIIQALSSQIMLEVSKKVDGQDFTSAKILLLINNDNTSEAKIKADKININGVISANNNFSVGTDGKVNIEGGKIHLKDMTGFGDEFEIDGNIAANLQTSSAISIYNKNNENRIDMNVTESDTPTLLISNGITGEYTMATGSYIESPRISQTSKRESKKNISKLKKALDIIKNVDIYKYNLKKEKKGTKKHIGFVIGDKYNYSKELTNNDNTGAEIYSLASVCLAGIKEQQEIIEGQAKTIQDLTKRIEKLEAKSNE